VSLLLQVAESATQFFIANDRPTVSGLVLAGSADFKTELSQSDMFDQRLQAIVLAVVDVSYGASPVHMLHTSRSSEGYLTNFLPVPWHAIKWRVPETTSLQLLAPQCLCF
jgi:hypothetical protein